ncbi:MAG: hypothetical protein JOZ18_17375 [Chloroflexi bacterium]|nr:hypothetical protein [Chloroflexota bacterium]
MASEVARIRAQIQAEYEAAERALYSFAEGSARHKFITARMERMEACVDELVTLVGLEEAAAILAETLDGDNTRQTQP